MIIISGYTINTPYEDEVKDLIKSLEKFKLEYKIYPYESKGNWIKNTQHKARIVQQALEEVSDCIWIDADAVINHYPVFFDQIADQDFDICCHYLNSPYRKNELLSGTFVFKDTPATCKLVDDWVSTVDSINSRPNDYNNMDQRVLQRLVDSRPLKIIPLPIEYIKINPKNGNIEDLKNNVIVHKQASRKNKSLTNKC